LTKNILKLTKYNSYKNGFKSHLQLERNLSGNTISAYQHDVALFLQFLTERRPSLDIREVSLSDLREFVMEVHQMGLGPYSQSRVISGLKSFFNYLTLEKIIATNPASLLKSPKLLNKLPVVLTEEDILSILENVDLSEPQGERNKAILEILYGCGLRVSELIDMRLSNLHLKDEIIMVTGKGNKQRLIPIGAAARKQLNTYLRQVRSRQTPHKNALDIVFLNRRGGKLSRQMIFLMVKKQAEKAGIHKNVSPHTFRHSFATHLVQHGADLRAVQQLLGHVSITTTEIYTHLDTNDLRETILRYHPQNRIVNKI